MGPTTAQNINIAIEKLVIEKPKLGKPRQTWLKGFDAIMRWYFVKSCHGNAATTEALLHTLQKQTLTWDQEVTQCSTLVLLYFCVV